MQMQGNTICAHAAGSTVEVKQTSTNWRLLARKWLSGVPTVVTENFISHNNNNHVSVWQEQVELGQRSFSRSCHA